MRNRLLFYFLLIGILPFVTLLVYVLFVSETKLVTKTKQEQLFNVLVVSKQIDKRVEFFIHEAKFLANLEVMDDLLADDIDKRISHLLTQKSKDFHKSVDILCVSEAGKIVASSRLDLLGKEFLFKEHLVKQQTLLSKEYLYIFEPIFASFDRAKKIGYLVFIYNLHDLDTLLKHSYDTHSFLYNKKDQIFIGEMMKLPITFAKKQDEFITQDHVVVYKQLLEPLQDFYVVYAVDKDVALALLYDFIRFTTALAVVIIVLVIIIAIKVSKGVVKPIEQLTQTTQTIIQTHNYAQKVVVESEDELQLLTQSFNELLATTNTALKKLQLENKIRLQRFSQLIELFNTITQAEDEDECIDIALHELQRLTANQNLHFIKEQSLLQAQKYINLYVTDFESNELIYYGSILLGFKSFQDEHEKRFYHSIGSMISLQLDRIRLIERTMLASKAKSAFISNMSHELRTPLNAIIGFAQFLLAYEELSEEQQDIVSNIESSAQYLLEMINEILDISKIEAGKMEVRIEEVDIVALLDSVYTMLSPLVQEKRLDFQKSYDGLEQRIYQSDPKMLKQIVVNLLSNAIKFTKEGYVHLHAYNKENKLFIEIKDSGVGIAKEDLTKLFSEFTQLENVMQKEHKGTGLGLVLSKKMANLLGGDVWLHSDGVGKGVVSVVSIPQVYTQPHEPS